MKFQLFLFIFSIVCLSEQTGQRSPKPKWNPEPEWQPEFKPVNQCQCLPNEYDMEITPIVEVDISIDTSLVCVSGSKLKQIDFHLTYPGRFTCNGATVDKGEPVYGIVYTKSNNQDTITLNNYTINQNYNNGNIVSQACGTIAGGKCSGDNFQSVSILEADDQKGCCGYGVNGLSELFRIVEITGRCASKCILGSSSWALAEPVNNYGLADKR